jgi:hypothetical protein
MHAVRRLLCASACAFFAWGLSATAHAQHRRGATGADAGAPHPPATNVTDDQPEPTQTGSSAAPSPAPSAAPSSPAPSGETGATEAEAEGEGGDETTAPETSLPAEQPVAPITAQQQRLLAPAPGELTDETASGTHRFLLPPYMDEWGRGHHTRVLFPFYFEHSVGDDHRLVIPPYYRVRSPTQSGDIFFPLFLHLNEHNGGAQSTLDVVGPVWYRTGHGPDRARSQNVGVFPLFSYGVRWGENGRLASEHFVAPGVFYQWWPRGQTVVAGPVVYLRRGSETNWAAFPFVFRHVTPQRSWTLIPPLLTYRSYSYDDNHTFHVTGLFFYETGPHLESYNLAPIFFHRHDRDRTRVTFIPFFHAETGPQHFTLFTPLGGYTRDHDESTLITPLYQNHRGITDVDAVAPFFFYSRTPRLGRRTFALLPFGFYSESNTGYSWGLFPFVARFHDYGRRDAIVTPLFVHSYNRATQNSITWVFPSIHAETHPGSHFFNIYPLVYTAGGPTWHHTIFAPFYWDVTSRDSGTQYNVVFPFFVRVADRRSVTEWVFPNHIYWERTDSEGYRGSEWDFFPFVQFGRPHRDEEYWSVLHGLVGHRRAGSFEQTQVFWIPFTTRGSPSSSAPQRARRERNGDVLFEM